MAKEIKSYFLGATSDVHFVPSPESPSIFVRSAVGEMVYLHLGVGVVNTDDKWAAAVRALDMLAQAVQEAMVFLAPERFAQPAPTDPDDDPDDEPQAAPVIVAEAWGDGDGDVAPSWWQAHPMAENELRAMHGDR